MHCSRINAAKRGNHLGIVTTTRSSTPGWYSLRPRQTPSTARAGGAYQGVSMANLTNPAQKAAAITPHDSDLLAGGVCRGIYVGGAGNLVVTLADDSASVTFTGVAAGTIYPICAKIVKATGTTATNLLALY